MIEVYMEGDQHVWVPVAKETESFPPRAFLPIRGLDETYLHGYKASISESKYLDALREIQMAYLNSESKVYPVQGGTRTELQYKAKWRQGRQKGSPLLGPTKGWVKLRFDRITEISVDDLAKALENSNSKFCDIEKITISPVLCNSTEELMMEAEKLSEIILGRVPEGQRIPKKSPSTQDRHIRDAAVVAFVINEANGVCENCRESAPFSKPNGEPYLEVHHVKHLARGGSDLISNAIAICPNCHREMHYGKNSNVLVEELYSKIVRLIPE